ncbi:MAG: uracil-DNA glycosylase [Thermodesulfobacteriota bacterium]
MQTFSPGLMNENRPNVDPELVREEFLLLLEDVRRHARARKAEGEPWLFRSPDALSVLKHWGKEARPGKEEGGGPKKADGNASKPRHGGGSIRREGLEVLEQELSGCGRCSLGAQTRRFVFGTGNPRARILLVGGCPGEGQDRQGSPFTGPAGELLGRIIGGMKLPAEDIYFTTLVKCRPESGRAPAPEEAAACLPFLARQAAAVRPEVIIALGRSAASALCPDFSGVSEEGCELLSFQGVPLVVTYAPEFLLQAGNTNEEKKRKLVVKRDMLMVKNILGLE